MELVVAITGQPLQNYTLLPVRIGFPLRSIRSRTYCGGRRSSPFQANNTMVYSSWKAVCCFRKFTSKPAKMVDGSKRWMESNRIESTRDGGKNSRRDFAPFQFVRQDFYTGVSSLLLSFLLVFLSLDQRLWKSRVHVNVYRLKSFEFTRAKRYSRCKIGDFIVYHSTRVFFLSLECFRLLRLWFLWASWSTYYVIFIIRF